MVRNMKKTSIVLQIESDAPDVQKLLQEALCDRYDKSPEGYIIEKYSESRGASEIFQIVVLGIDVAAALLTIAEITGLVDWIKAKIQNHTKGKVSVKEVDSSNKLKDDPSIRLKTDDITLEIFREDGTSVNIHIGKVDSSL